MKRTTKLFCSFPFLAQCPPDHPFVYVNGNHCCKTKEERLIQDGITPWWPQSEIDDGTCDGLDFNRQSACCRDEAHTPCPHASGCFDNSGSKYLIHLKNFCSTVHFSCSFVIGVSKKLKKRQTSLMDDPLSINHNLLLFFKKTNDQL